VWDWGEFASSFVTLGARLEPWETMTKAPGHETFGYFDVAHFHPDEWKNEYPNPAFDRMTERDAAWMARILSRFTPHMVRTLAEMAQLAGPSNTDYLERVLDGRLQKILDRYLTRLSPIADVALAPDGRLCGVDLAEWRGLRAASRFVYTAALDGGGALPTERRPGGVVCIALPHVAPDGGADDDAAERYMRVRIADGVAASPLVAHLYDLGPRRGFFLAGLER
jgi:hypothetical protein